MGSSEERARAKALAGQPYREGTFKLDGRFVRVSAQLYPKISWWIEECRGAGIPIPGTRRRITDDEGARLEGWL